MDGTTEHEHLPRGLKKPSGVFRQVLDHAHETVWLEWKRATEFDHTGIKGTARENAVGAFLTAHLPKQFAVTTGEAIDCFDNRTSQLDIVIYDHHRNCPVSASSSTRLLPAESLLAAIEVKSILSKAELDKCYMAASKLRKLKPYKSRHFVSARTQGEGADDNPRCLYVVIAFDSDLGETDWLKKEWQRANDAAMRSACEVTLIDLIYVVDKGLINTTRRKGKLVDTSPSELFQEWLLSIVNFLSRENPRRDPVDWQNYAPRTSKGWIDAG